MLAESSRWYDDIYAHLDYAGHVAALRDLIGKPTGKRLLDIACGTGRHLECFRGEYEIEGLDLNEELLAMARARLGEVPLHLSDFCDFDLGRRFAVITNLFSSIGYARTRERLDAAIACVARHLEPGGIALIEPWFVREAFCPGGVHATLVDAPDLKICRMNRSEIDGDLSVIDFHYLVATPKDGVRHFRERHELAMFAIDDFASAGTRAGLTHEHIQTDRFSRGLHIFRPEA